LFSSKFSDGIGDSRKTVDDVAVIFEAPLRVSHDDMGVVAMNLAT
jgi:hypothetical protein